MSAAPQLEPGTGPEQLPAPAPAQEAPKPPASLNEALTGAPAPQSPETLRQTEARLAEEGMAKLNEMGKNLNLQAEAGAQEFKQETKSWWERVKGRFSKKEGPTPGKGDAEILQEIEKADATFREFRNEMARIMAHGGEEDLRILESNLSAAYEQLAPQVAAEGADESKAMKKALKTQEMPQATELGAKLNYVTKRLADVRAKLASGATGSAEALAAANAAYQEQAAAAAPAESPAPAAPEAPQAAQASETAPAEPKKAETKADRDRSELEKASAGKPGAKLLDEYFKVRDLKSDKYGNIAARAFDPVKGEIRLTYEDGSQLRRYATGLVLRILPGGKVEEVKPEAQIVEEAEPEEEIFNEAEKAQLAADVDKTRRIAEMGTRVDAAMAAEDEAAAAEAVGSLEKDAAAEKMAERQRQWDADKAEHERQRNEKLAASAKRQALGMKTSEDARTASGEIGGEPAAPVEDAQIETSEPAEPVTTELVEPPPAEASSEAPAFTAEPDPEMEAVAAPAAVEAPPAPEKKESVFDKLDAKLDEAAAEIMKMPEAAESPKTFPTKVGKLPADKFLEAFKAVGAVTEAEAKDLAEQFKLESEEFDAMRKKLSLAVRKRMKG